MTTRFNDPTTFIGAVTLPNGTVTNAMVDASAEIARTKLALDSLSKYPIPLTDWKTFDAMATTLPGTAASDDLGLVSGTFGTNTPSIQTSDAKAATVTQKARCLVQLPQEYIGDEDVQFRFFAGMVTTVSDTTATLDLSVYKSDGDTTDDGNGDLVTTAATTINSLTFANVDFVLTDTNLSPGDWLDVQATIAITDGATGTAVIGCFGNAWLMCDVRG